MELACILIVDDSEADQFICRDLIESQCPNTDILQAYDGQEALNILEKAQTKPNLIILDINMPGMDGYEFLNVYDQKPDSEKTSVVIMLTSSKQTEDRNRSTSYQCVIDYFTKPLEEEDIDKLKTL